MNAASGVTVTGTGRAQGVPDVLRATLAAEARSSGVQGALDGATAALEAMRAALAAAGIADADRRTGMSAVHTEHDQRGRPAGYVARWGLAVVLRDLSAAGTTLSAVLAAGGDAARLDGLELGIDDPAPLLARARELAWADALEQAEHYARLAGRSLGALTWLDASGGAGPGPVGMRREAMSLGYASDLVIDAGTSEVSASVTACWELA